MSNCYQLLLLYFLEVFNNAEIVVCVVYNENRAVTKRKYYLCTPN